MQANSGTVQLQRKYVQGWTEYVEEAYTAAKDAFCLWCSYNRPKFDPVFNLFKKASTMYKYAFRYCTKLTDATKADKLAIGLLWRVSG